MSLGCCDDATPALICISDAYEVLIDIVSEQSAYWRILAAQDNDVPLLLTLRPLGLEAGELLARVWRLLVVAGEQDDQVTRVLHGLVHHFHEAFTGWGVIVLYQDLVALFGEHIGHLARDGCYRAATAQEEIVALLRAGGHGRVSG